MKTLFKNKTSKNISCLVVCIFAVMTFSCNNGLEIDITPNEVMLRVNKTSISYTASETDTRAVSKSNSRL